MILSRTFAKSRIRRGERPGKIAAWGPVLIDGVILFGVLFALFPVLRNAMLERDFSQIQMALVFLGVYFIPIQVVLILSAFWAARSRGIEDAETKG